MRPCMPLGRIWGMPVGLAVASAAGILFALLGDGWWDGVSWVSLGLLLVVMAWHVVASARQKTSRGQEIGA